MEVDPVPHLAGNVVPLILVAHYGLAAFPVVLGDGDLLADVLLGDPEFLFHAQFDRQAMGVPAAFALHTTAFQGMIATNQVLDGPRHDVMDTRHSVG